MLRSERATKLKRENAIVISDVWKRFRLYHEKNQSLKEFALRRKRASFEEFWALKKVSFDVKKGESIGLIGENGSGKSTMLKIIAGIYYPDKGSVFLDGRLSALLELGAGFHPELTGRENVFLNGTVLGMRGRQLREQFGEIVRFAELEKFIDMPVKNYSSGMYMRLGFAIAINVDPDILIVDEVLAVGDAHFQRKCFDKMYEFKESGRTIILVSHALDMVQKFCDRAIWFDRGEMKITGETRDVIEAYLKSVNKREDAAAADEDKVGFERRGSREIEIAGVKILDGHGRERKTFETGESITIEVSYLASSEIDNPVFGVAIFNKAGVYCYGTNTKIDNISTGMISGTGSVYLEYPTLNLLSDSYVLDVAIYDKRCVHPYDFHSKAYAFNLRSSLQDEGIFLVPHKWNLLR